MGARSCGRLWAAADLQSGHRKKMSPAYPFQPHHSSGKPETVLFPLLLGCQALTCCSSRRVNVLHAEGAPGAARHDQELEATNAKN